jgi:hypothetical protein
MPKRKQRKLPKPGSTFEKHYRSRVYQLRVIQKEGGIGFEINGRMFPTPTAAAKSITKHEVNGWKFWNMD